MLSHHKLAELWLLEAYQRMPLYRLVAERALHSEDHSGREFGSGTWSFTIAAQFRLGTCSRNPVRGPSYQDADLALLKCTTSTERFSPDFRAEVFNLTNTPPLNAPNVVVGSEAFGTITSAGRPRVMQLALKLNF